MLFVAIIPSFWGSFADTYGRRPIYLICLVAFVLGCTGLAQTRNFSMLVSLRVLQAVGSSALVAVGAGTIGDITSREERGTYMGTYSSTIFLGPVIGPTIGGVLSEYAGGWRSIFYFMAIWGAVVWIFVFLFLPETLRDIVTRNGGSEAPFDVLYSRITHKKSRVTKVVDNEGKVIKRKGTRGIICVSYYFHVSRP